MQDTSLYSPEKTDETSSESRSVSAGTLKNGFDKVRSDKRILGLFGKYNQIIKPRLILLISRLKSWISEFRNSSLKTKFKMLKVPVLLFILLTLIMKYGPFLGPPKISVSFPGRDGAEIPLDSTIEVQFDRDMMKATVMKAFSITPMVKGAFSWSGNTRMYFTPEEPLKLATKYQVIIGRGAASSFLIPKLKSDIISFETLGHPKVILASPQIEAPDAGSPITVMFDRPMIPLTTAGEKENLEPAFILDPEVEGEGRWLGTTAYQFKPLKPFKNATTYTYRVPAGMKSKDGGELQEDLSYSFSTPRPRILRTSPADNYKYSSPTASVSATLNLTIDPQSAKTAMHLYKINESGEEEIPTSVRTIKNYQVGMYPAAPLEREREYIARIDSGLLTTEGNNGLENAYSWKFTTAPRPKIIKTKPENAATEVSEEHSISVSFISPMNEKSFAGNVIISPAPEREPSLSFSSYDGSHTLNIGTYLSRSSNYTITIRSVIKDQYGVSLGEDYSFSFSTAAYKPSVSIVPTGTYFASFNQEVAPRIVAKAVNVNELTYKLYKLRREDFLKIYKLRFLSSYPQNTLQSYDASIHELVREWKETYQEDLNVPVHVITKVEYENGDRIPSGFYFLDVRIADGKHDNLVMIVTKNTLTFKTSPKQAFVWAVDKSSGDVISEMEIELVKIEGKAISNGKTNSDGVYQADMDIRGERENYAKYNDPIFAFSKKADDVGVVVDGWSEGIAPYSYGLQTYYDPQESDTYASTDQLKIYIVLDRPIYRPGQTVYYKGVVRRDDDGKYSLLTGENTLKVKVADPQGREIINEDSQLSSYGTFSGEFILSEEGSVGNFVITANILGNGFSQSFQVEEYKRPDFAVNVATDKADYVNGDTVKAEVAANFYFGAPLDHALLTWTLVTSDYSYRWHKDSSYEFGDSDDYWYEPWWNYGGSYYSGKKVTEGKGTTDQGGKYDISLPINISDKKTNQRMRLEAVVKEESNQVIAASHEWTVHQAELHVGIKPQLYSSQAGREAKVEVVTVGIDGQEIPNTPVSVSFYKRTWSYIKEKNPDDGEFYWTTKVNDVFITSVDTVTGEFGRGVVAFTPAEGGTYHAVAEVRDSQGRSTKSGTHLWISGSGRNYPMYNHDRIVIVPDKQEYEIGDEAKIVASVPYETTTGLFTVERGSVFEYKVVKTTPEEQSANFSIKENFAPNAYVSAIFIKQGKEVKDPTQFKMGVTEIRVNNPKNKVSISMKPNKNKYSPGEEVKVDLETKDGTGKLVQTELMVALVDEAVWSLARIKLADIYETYFRPRNLNVLTANDLTKSMDRLNANVNLGSKGGSGGGGGDNGGMETLREKFLDTAYWNAHIETDVNGKANFSLKLPDNLTTWRLMGVAVSKETSVGDALTNLIVTKDVLVQPHLPRFLSVGDLPKLGMTVHNNTESVSNVAVKIKTEGVKVLEEDVKKISVPAKGSQSVYWNAEVENGNSAKVILEAEEQQGGFSDAVSLTLPVLTYYTPEVVATSGEAKDVGNEKVFLPGSIVPDMGKLEITLSPALGSGIQDAVDYLLAYPYWCSEQSISRVMPLVYLLQIAKEAKLDKVGGYSISEIENMVSDGIQRLINTQHPDGSWGWWVNSDSDPYLTGRIIDGLVPAKNFGFTVPDFVIDNAKNYLNRELAGNSRSLELQAYLAQVVTKAGGVDAGILNRLMDKRWQMNELGRAYLLRAMQEQGGSRRDRVRLYDELTSNVHKTNTTAHWEIDRRDWSMISGDTTLTSVVLEAIVKENNKAALIPDVTRWLIQTRRDGHWESTHETGSAVKAIAEMLLARKETKLDENWQILFNGVIAGKGEFKKGDFLKQEINGFDLEDLEKEKDIPVKIQRSGKGALYYNMNLRYFLPFEEVEAEDLGIVVIREFVDRSGKILKQEVIDSDDELWVRLIILTPSIVHHVVLEDKLPAGLEAVNESLATTSLLNVDRLKVPDDRSLLYFSNHEIRDDRVVLFAETLPAGVYEYTYRVRPTTPGRYHHPPAQAYNMYIPDISGHSAGGWVEIKE